VYSIQLYNWWTWKWSWSVLKWVYHSGIWQRNLWEMWVRISGLSPGWEMMHWEQEYLIVNHVKRFRIREALVPTGNVNFPCYFELWHPQVCWPLHSYIDMASVLIGTVFIVSGREVCGILMSGATAVCNTQTELHSVAFS